MQKKYVCRCPCQLRYRWQHKKIKHQKKISLGIHKTHKILKMKIIAQRYHHSKAMHMFFFPVGCLRLYRRHRSLFFTAFCILFSTFSFDSMPAHRFLASTWDEMKCSAQHWRKYLARVFFFFSWPQQICWCERNARTLIHKTNINRPHKKLLHNTFRRKSNNP